MDERRGLSRDVRGKIWADGAFNFEAFETKHKEGWRFRATEMTEDATTDDLPRSDTVIPVMVVHANDMLSPVSPEGTGNAGVAVGDHVVSFTAPSALRVSDEAGNGTVDLSNAAVEAARAAVR